MLLSVVHILPGCFLCVTDTNICMYTYFKDSSVRPLANRNNIVILHLIHIQKRLFLVGFTVNITQLEMIKETIVKTIGIYTMLLNHASISLFLYLNRITNESNPDISFLLHIYLLFCSKKHFSWRYPLRSHPCEFTARSGGAPSQQPHSPSKHHTIRI